MVIKISKDVRRAAKKAFLLRGSIKRCAETITVDRTTITRVIKTGTGEERVVNAIAEYFNKGI